MATSVLLVRSLTRSGRQPLSMISVEKAADLMEGNAMSGGRGGFRPHAGASEASLGASSHVPSLPHLATARPSRSVPGGGVPISASALARAAHLTGSDPTAAMNRPSSEATYV